MSVPSTTALRRTAANATALVAAHVIGRGLTFVAVVVAARVVGAEAFGTYGTAAALAVVVSLVSTLGMVPLLVREMTRRPEEAARWLAAADRVKHGSNLLMLAVLVGVAGPILGLGAPGVTASFLLGAGYALGSYVENRLAWSRAVERMSLVTEASAVYGVVAGSVGVVAVWATGSVVVFCGAPLVGQVVVLVWLGARLPRDLSGGRPRPGDVGALVRAVVPFAAAFVALTLFYKVDVLLLERWRTLEEVGFYAAAYRFMDLVHALTLAVVGAVYPALARRAAGPGGSPGRVGGRVAELLLLATVPVGAALLLAREAAIVGVFGSAYAQAVPVLALLAPAIPALAFNLYAGQLLAASNRMRWMAWLYAGAVVLKTVLDLWLIPAGGPRGAGLATLVSEGVLAVGFGVVLARALDVVPGRRTAGILAAVTGLALAASLAPGPGGGLLPAALFGLATVGLYHVAGVVPPGEWAAVRGALARRGARPGRELEAPGSG